MRSPLQIGSDPREDTTNHWARTQDLVPEASRHVPHFVVRECSSKTIKKLRREFHKRRISSGREGGLAVPFEGTTPYVCFDVSPQRRIGGNFQAVGTGAPRKRKGDSS